MTWNIDANTARQIIDMARQLVDDAGSAYVYGVDTKPKAQVWLTIDAYETKPDCVHEIWHADSRGVPIGRPLMAAFEALVES